MSMGWESHPTATGLARCPARATAGSGAPSGQNSSPAGRLPASLGPSRWLTCTHLCFGFLAHGLLLGSSGPDIVEFCVCLQSRRAGASVLVDLCASLGSSGPGWGGCLHCTPVARRAETSSPFSSRPPLPAWRVSAWCGGSVAA